MALKKSIPTLYGVEAKHWIVSEISIDRISLSLEIQLAGYASKEAEESKNNPLVLRVFHVQYHEVLPENITTTLSAQIPPQLITPEIIKEFETISTIGYELVKKSEEFQDAEIV